ncbi:NADPH oxidase 5-like isoform X2 [Crassostrea angulata]|uniref:NADPH oxidase 5-like isoform X2 n=1 Tax=Magallana angulata TaxID=2784310 RepID=UPI0022B0BAC7|nr:NADPH oxidase 5-like isoform X2 [Crassostrea angulata]
MEFRSFSEWQEEVLSDANFIVRISRYEDNVEITGSRSIRWTEVTTENNKNLRLQQLTNDKPCFNIQRYLPDEKAPSSKHELKSVISYSGNLNSVSTKMMEPAVTVESNNNHDNLGFKADDADGDQIKPAKKPDDTVIDIEVNDITVTSSTQKTAEAFGVHAIDEDGRDLPNGGGFESRQNEVEFVGNGEQQNEQTQPEKANDRKKSVAIQDEELKWLSWMEIQFTKIAGEDGEINLEEFKDALGVKRSFFAERFFNLFDTDKSGSIECGELMDGLRMLTKGTPAQKLKFLFDVYDVDGSGSIDREELKTVLRSCMEESSLTLSEEDLDDLTDVLFDAADEDNSGSITFEELKAELEKHPGVIENLTISAAQWLKPPAGTNKKTKGWTEKLTWKYIRNNLRKVVFLVLYILINLGLAGYTINKYIDSNAFVIVARIGGMNLNFNCMFILVLMLRKCLTYIRATPLAGFLPLDQNIVFHKMVGGMIAFYGITHTLAHIGNALYIEFATPEKNLTTVDILFTTKAEVGWVGHSAYITGWPILVILIIIVICSLPFVRRGGHFQVFYWTHMLYIPFWILLILHGPIFWMFFILPGVIFILEKISRSKIIKRARFGNTHITEVHLLPSRVCHLTISRPDNFKYQPGDYIFIQIPVIAANEWHPFTISSAPEMKGHIWLHVRSAGHWTNKLYEYFSELDPVNLGKPDIVLKKRRQTLSPALLNFKASGIKRKGSQYLEKSQKELEHEKRVAQKNKKVRIKCHIDGPYGTATREIFETEHAVLVGAGIGVTPMASILQSVMYRYKESKRTCPQCQHSFYGPISEAAMKLKKVDFIWINRDQKSFEWFVGLLNHIEKEQIDVAYEEGKEPEKVIEMHMYMTAAQGKTDMKGIGLQIALDLIHKKDNRDLITGLKTRTQAGRPNWNQIFDKISKEKKGKVKVFFCGAPQLGKIIKSTCMKYKFNFSKENF